MTNVNAITDLQKAIEWLKDMSRSYKADMRTGFVGKSHQEAAINCQFLVNVFTQPNNAYIQQLKECPSIYEINRVTKWIIEMRKQAIGKDECPLCMQQMQSESFCSLKADDFKYDGSLFQYQCSECCAYFYASDTPKYCLNCGKKVNI